MVKNALGEVQQWRVRWFAPRTAAKDRLSFMMLAGPSYLELIDVDNEMLVASTSKLVNGGKQLPAATVKDAVRVLQGAALAEDNGQVRCNECKEEAEAHEQVACNNCGRCYHEKCAPGYGACDTEEWWCPWCEELANSA